jgi:iron complex outermembrane receptor protein
MMKRFFIVLAMSICCAGVPCAQELILDEIEVKAQKETEVESLEVREVRESAAKDTGEALKDIPGISRLRKGGIANDIVLRGHKKDNINVLIDGTKFYGACPNKMDPPAFHLDFAEVDTIEVLKGAFDVRNQGSLGGVVDIKTKSARKGYHLEIHGGYESFESFNSSAVVSYGAERFSILGGGAYKSSNPYKDGNGQRFTEVYPLTSPNRYKPSEIDSTAYRIKTGWTKFTASPIDDHKIELSYTRQEADDVMYPYLLMDSPTDETDRINVRYEIGNLGEVLSSLKFQTYFNKVEHDMTDERRCSSTMNTSACTGSLPRPYSMRTYAESETKGVKAESEFLLLGTTTLGADYYEREWDATTTMYMMMPMPPRYVDQASMPDVKVENFGVFVMNTKEITDTIDLSSGLRLDVTDTEPRKDRTSVYNLYSIYHGPMGIDQSDTYVSGNIKMNYTVSDALSLFAGFGHTERVPDPEERYIALRRMGTQAVPDRVGNPALDTVKNNEFDAGLKYKTDKVLVKTQLFYSDLDDYIITQEVFNGTRYARTYTGVEATMYGGEASARFALPMDLYATLAASYTRGENDSDNTDLPEIPPFKGSAGLRYDRGTYFAEIEELFASKQTKVDALIDEDETAGWGITNVKAGYEYKKIKVYAGVKNLFDKYYLESLSYLRNPFSSGIKIPEPGRTLYVNLQYDF